MNSIDFVEMYSAIMLKKHEDKKTQEHYYTVSLVKRNNYAHTESDVMQFRMIRNSPRIADCLAVIFETYFNIYLPSIYENKLDAGRIIETFTKVDGRTKGYKINSLYGLQNVLDLFLTVNVHLKFIYNHNGVILYTID